METNLHFSLIFDDRLILWIPLSVLIIHQSTESKTDVLLPIFVHWLLVKTVLKS